MHGGDCLRHDTWPWGATSLEFNGANMRKPVRTLALLSVAALAAGMGLGGSANAAPPGDPEVLAKNLA